MGDSECVGHEPCPECGSQDNLARYSDGHAHCFTPGCTYREASGSVPGVPASTKKAPKDLLHEGLEPYIISKRGLNQKTCEKFGIKASARELVFPYHNRKGELVGQKIRSRKSKSFACKGEVKDLFGAHLWPAGGRKIIITEGELDAMSVSQVQDNKWPVVSIPNGAQSAKAALKRSLDFLESFQEVVLCFDSDEAGKAAAADCVELFTPGKVRVAQLPKKDANEMLMGGMAKELLSCIWNAQVHRPDGILSALDCYDRVASFGTQRGLDYPWKALTETTHGLRKGEITTLCAGSGIGKSTFCRELEYWLIQKGLRIGVMALEESVGKTLTELIGIHLNTRLALEGDKVDPKAKEAAFQEIFGKQQVWVYDHFGSQDPEVICARIKYLAKACQVDFVILDHVSIIVSGIEEGEERRLIDNLMTRLRSLVEETGIGVILVSHLKRPEGRSHEEGAKTSLGQLRGSAAIGQLSDMVIGFERDQQGDSPNETSIRVLKNRVSGDTGLAGVLQYDKETGRLREVTSDFDEGPV